MRQCGWTGWTGLIKENENIRIEKNRPSDKKWVGRVRILLFLSLWEICYFLGLIDPIRFSHPSGVIDAATDYAFLRGFALMVTQLGCASLFGGTFGVAIGSLLIKNGPLAHAAIRLLHIALWLPYLISWALPLSYSGYPNRFVLTVWTWLVSAFAVSLSTCYHYLNGRVIMGLEWGDVKFEVIRRSILQALLICLISQVWLGPYGWMFFWSGAEFIQRVYAATLLLFVSVVLINDVCGYDFERQAKAHSDIIRRTITSRHRQSIIDACLIVLAFFVFWELLGVSPVNPFVSSPSAMLKGGYYFLLFDFYRQSVFWNDITISLIELLGGLFLGWIVALIVSKEQSSRPIIKSYVLPILPTTYIIPILLPLYLNGWVGPVDVWWTVLTVAAVCFYPCIELFSGLRDLPFLSRALFVADHALPYAFVATTFGEAMTARAGLGFRMMYGRATLSFPIGLGAALITVVLFVILSVILRTTAKRMYSVP